MGFSIPFSARRRGGVLLACLFLIGIGVLNTRLASAQDKPDASSKAQTGQRRHREKF